MPVCSVLRLPKEYRAIVDADLWPVVDVDGYDAVGDGVTDDTDAIQRAINAGHCQFTPGKTYLCGAVSIPSNRYIFGYGSTWKRKAATSGSKMILLAGNNIHFYDCIFDGNKSNQTSSSEFIGVSSARSVIRFESCTFQNSRDYITLQLTSSSNVWVTKCRFFVQGDDSIGGANGAAVYGVADGNSNWFVTNNYAELGHANNYTGAKLVQCYATNAGGANNINVTNNTIVAPYAIGGSCTLDNTTDIFTLGFTITSANEIVTGTQVTIKTFNTFPTNTSSVVTDQVCNAIVIDSTHIKLATNNTNAQAGTSINWTSDGSSLYLYTPQGNMGVESFATNKLTVTGNNIKNCHYGISITAGNSTITGNSIEQARFWGIELGNSAYNNAVTGNTLLDCGHGIYCTGLNKNTTISNNTIDMTSPSVPFGTGIYILGDDIHVTGNSIKNPADIGINTAAGACGTHIIGNYVTISADRPLNGGRAPQCINIGGKEGTVMSNFCHVSTDGTSNSAGCINAGGHKISIVGNTVIGASGGGLGTGTFLKKLDVRGISVGSGTVFTEGIIANNFVSGFVDNIRMNNSSDNSGTVIYNNISIGGPNMSGDYSLRGDELPQTTRFLSLASSTAGVGMYKRGDIGLNTAAATGGSTPMGWICTQTGAGGTMTATVNTTNGSNIVEIATNGQTVCEGMRITVAASSAITAGFVDAILGKEATYTGNLSSVNTTTNILTLDTSCPPTGTPIKFSGGGLPSGITSGIIYYWRRDTQTTGRIYTTISGCYAGTSPVSVVGAGSGTYTSTVIFISSVAAGATVSATALTINTAAILSPLANVT